MSENEFMCHIWLRKDGRRNITIVQDISRDPSFQYAKFLRFLKKSLNCGGCIPQDGIIQLTGDQCIAVKNHIVNEGIVSKNLIKVHNF